MNLYTMVLSAWTDTESGKRLRLKPGLVLATDEDDAHRRGHAAAIVAFPELDGWFDHQAAVVCVPSPLDLEGYRLTWQIEERP